MEHTRWQKIDDIFKSALELPEAECDAFLERACAGDLELRHEVEMLIEADAQAGSFLEAPAVEAATRLLAEIRLPAEDGPPFPAGQTIGPYKTIREIGRGGMGTVYEAVRADDQYK